jgi:CDP-diglyceride synthetase
MVEHAGAAAGTVTTSDIAAYFEKRGFGKRAGGCQKTPWDIATSIEAAIGAGESLAVGWPPESGQSIFFFSRLLLVRALCLHGTYLRCDLGPRGG